MTKTSDRRCHCTVPGHGMDCIVAQEKVEDARWLRNKRRRRDERRIIETEEVDHDE